MLRVIMLNVIMLNVIMLNVIMLSVIMLNVIMLSVVAPLSTTNPAFIKIMEKVKLLVEFFGAKKWKKKSKLKFGSAQNGLTF